MNTRSLGASPLSLSGVLQVVGGVYAHSLAVLTDAAHMLSDVSAFAISLFAGIYALR